LRGIAESIVFHANRRSTVGDYACMEEKTLSEYQGLEGGKNKSGEKESRITNLGYENRKRSRWQRYASEIRGLVAVTCGKTSSPGGLFKVGGKFKHVLGGVRGEWGTAKHC